MINYWTKIAAHAVFGNIPYGHVPYQWLQKRFGGLKTPGYEARFRRNAALVSALVEHGMEISGARIMEIGTGRIPTSPVGFWLTGAKRVDTYDVSGFLDKVLTYQMIRWLRDNHEVVRAVYGQRLVEERYERLCRTEGADEALELCKVFYHCPANASRVDLPGETYDAHVSINTIEHIPERHLPGIIRESRRLLKRSGLAAHMIDHTDHWAKADPRVSSAHFLKYSDSWWRIIAGNKYAYLNRLRWPEIEQLFVDMGMKVLNTDVTYDENAAEWLRSQPRLAERFAKMSERDMAIALTLVVARRDS